MAGETARQSQVAEQVEQLELNAGRLTEVVCGLEERLNLVLRDKPENESQPSTAKETEELVAQATRLRGINVGLVDTTASIVDITRRLEV